MRIAQWWLGAFLSTVLLCSFSIEYLDMPIARLLFKSSIAHKLGVLGELLSSATLVGLITIVILPLTLIRLVRGTLSKFGETMIVAGSAAIGAFAVNDNVLKWIFGREDVATYLVDPTGPIFHMLGGNVNSSFPSGHAVMVTAGLSACARVYPRLAPIAIALLAIMSAMLLLGHWHFLSDVIAGLFVGGSEGLLAGELAKSHFSRKSQAS
jgi:membrane-associated phospholipid phosphatase